MLKETEDLILTINRFVINTFGPRLRMRIKTYEELLITLFFETESFLNSLSVSEKHSDTFKTYLGYYDRIKELIRLDITTIDSINEDLIFAELEEKINEIYERIPEKVKEEQSADRFTLLPDDRIGKRILKSCKIILYRISLIPLKVNNIFRKLFKKEPVELRYWSHVIPYQSLIKQQLENELLLDLERFRNSTYSQISSIINETWETLNSFLPDESAYVTNSEQDIEDIGKRIAGLRNTIENQIKDLYDPLIQDLQQIIENRKDRFLSDYPMAGTIEYNNRSLKKSKLIGKNKKVLELWDNNSRGWKNTFFALFDDWKSDLEIYTLRNEILSKTTWIGDMQGTDDYRLVNELSDINHVFKDVSDRISESLTNLKKKLIEAKYLISKQLNNNTIPVLTGKISTKNLSGLIGKLEKEIESGLAALSESRVVVKAENYKKPLRSNELEKLSISDLASFELLPRLKVKLSNVKNILFVKLAELNEAILDLDNIAIFALDIALTNSENPDSNDAESQKIAIDGIERAKSKAIQIGENIDKLYQENFDEIRNSMLEFCDDLKKYTDNENILELRVRIVKSKAIEQSKSIRKELKQKVISIISQIGIQLSRFLKFLQSGASEYRKKFFLIAPQAELSREVSDFLSYSNNKIDGLPILYKNLYKIQPVNDRELFVGREQELTKLRKAYDNWLAGHYSASILIGEKWGGSTSLITNFITTNNFTHKIHRTTLSERILDVEKLSVLISSELSNVEVTDPEKLIELINGLPSNRIIILEDIQKIYLRRIEGFRSLKMLFRLINSTYKRIFWLASCTIYAWNYLRRSISIDDYFSHIILMEKLKEEDIVEIIKKRNRISGLNVVFEPDNKKISVKKIRNLAEEGKQKYLQGLFFDDLTDFSESNISLALLFWLLSTRNINENRLVIGSFEKPDLSFVKVMNMDRILILLALILHDGLNEKELSEVNNVTPEEAKMTVLMLLEDGIIYQENSNYLVNPMIYRSIIRLLKSKNLLQE